MNDANNTADPPGGTTVDGFLGGTFALVQARRGAHRCGSDAILLAATVPTGASGRVVDLGSGPGAAGFAVACRGEAAVTLVDCDPESLALAAESCVLPENASFAKRIAMCRADVAGPSAPFVDAGLRAASVDRVIANPPYFSPAGHRTPPSAGRAQARMLSEAGLEPWIRRAAFLLRPSGMLHLILTTALVPDLLTVVQGRFGGVDLMPVHARADTTADRVLVRAIKGSRASLRFLPPIVMHEADGSYSARATEILRAGQEIAWLPRR
ncbi:tRNA1(Val) (adenine(37)-N6)-methyltransferase [Amorphus sp. 3PC139-8]|uniref:tRNA1(Val) (adenine(37)-N6)-methyltransferase n=1 Tax=Amorphus sp. 3PC139-8 TaxID=2735676 RepID=UPI00345DEC47